MEKQRICVKVMHELPPRRPLIKHAAKPYAVVPLRAPITARGARLNALLLKHHAGSLLCYLHMISGQENNISAVMGHYSVLVNCLVVTLCISCFIISCKFTHNLMSNDSQTNACTEGCNLCKLLPIVSANAHPLF